MTGIRNPAVAGSFYPSKADELHRVVDYYLQQACLPEDSFTPKAIIAPHAGYVYSGAIAASAYASLLSARQQIHRVVLLGPAHRVPIQGLALPKDTAFSTPLGTVVIDQAAVTAIKDLPQVTEFDQAHELEHSLEVQLPFLQTVLDDFQIVPLVVGNASIEDVAQVLERLWGGPETLIVISSDLSHYHDYQSAKRLDQATTDAIEHLAPEQITYDHACGRIPIRGLLRVAQNHGLQAHTLDLRNSGDTAGPRDRVVGYGAYVFH